MSDIADTTEVIETTDAPATEETFTKADVERIVRERIARSQFKDYDEIKAKAARLDELEAAQQTELEKAQNAAKAAADELAALRTQLRQQAVTTAIVNAAAAAGAVNPQAVARLIDAADIEVGEDGTVDATEVVSAFLGKPENAFLVAQPAAPALPKAPGTANQGSGPKVLTMDEVAALTPEQLAADPQLLAQAIAARDTAR